MKKLLLALSAILVIVLSSCSFGPDFQKPTVETPDSFMYDSLKVDSLTNLKWWDLFEDPVLDTLIVTSLRQNRDLRIAASRIVEARAALGFTKADQYPKIDITAGATRGNYFNGIQLSDENSNFYVAAPLSWEIDFWGKFRRATESSRAQLMASEYSLRTVQISLITEVVGVYFQMLDYTKRIEISRETLQSREQSLDIIQQRYDKGIIPEIDLNQAQIQKEIAAAAIPIFKRFRAKTENALNVLVGKLPGEIEKGIDLEDQMAPPDIPTGLPSELLERRPDIIEAEYLVKAQNANIGVAEAMRLPAISLTGILGIASDDLSALTSGGPAWSLSGTLFGPLFNFNKNIRRVEIEEERTKQALFSYENVVLNAFREVEDALIEIQTYKEQIDAKRRQVAAASNAAKLSRERYDQGITSYLEVLETERSWFNAELELSDVKRAYLSSYIKLYKALGGGWVSEDEMNAASIEAQMNNETSADGEK